MNRNPRKIEQYRAANLECGRIIVADPAKYPGLMQQWAQLVLAKTRTLPIGTTEQSAESPGPLFQTEAA